MRHTNTRYQTTTAGRIIIHNASTQLADHVAVALKSMREGRTAWIKCRSGDPDTRLWAVQFGPDNQITPLAWHHAVSFDQAGNPDWIRQVRTIADRLSSFTTQEAS